MLTGLLLLLLAAHPLAPRCVAVDGDTLRCGSERVRLLGIDAPELRGHCQQGRRCAPGDPIASTDSLRSAMRRGPIAIQRVGTDRYGRAIYKPQWDTGARLARICGAAR